VPFVIKLTVHNHLVNLIFKKIQQMGLGHVKGKVIHPSVFAISATAASVTSATASSVAVAASSAISAPAAATIASAASAIALAASAISASAAASVASAAASAIAVAATIFLQKLICNFQIYPLVIFPRTYFTSED
jgi:hypothetical protein